MIMSTTPHRRPKRFPPVVFSMLLVSAIPAARADAITVGSLLCTTSDIAGSAVQLSCNYNGVAGGDGSLTGQIIIKEVATFRSGKHVLMWSVLAHKTSMSSNALVGTYHPNSGGKLTGGKVGDIILLPSRSTARTHEGAMTVVELQLNPAEYGRRHLS
jgi:Protein of unknown function (DUF992)